MIELVGKTIREHREQQGLTIEKLAEKAGVSDSYISRLERNNVANARIAKLVDVANALGLDIVDLFTKNELNDPYTIELMKYLGQLSEADRSEVSKSILNILKHK